ncbi:MAG: hypothetical protein CL843_20100 [Crocinitomicaceae bacterium]|nr:hypothetical protein [Crocinitomicaceae bacterium]MAX82468.1 hypothetical protein [Crocinitomicaceae bacterium]|tara:strand:+ start:6299 stop:8971 length:2673 start_codon:yes stop_codon:yes gene_type:complete
MKNLLRILFFVLFCVQSSSLLATSNIDSLEHELQRLKGVDQLQVLDQITKQAVNINLNEALRYAHLYHNKALNEKDNTFIYESAFRLGVIYKYVGNLDSSLFYIKESLTIAEATHDSVRMGRSFNSLGVIYKTKGELEEAKVYYNKSLKIAHDLGDQKTESKIYNNLGLLEQMEGKYTEALKHFSASVELKKLLEDKKGLVGAYNNIALNFTLLSKTDESIRHFKMALEIAKEIHYDYYQGVLNNNLGEIYLSIDSIDQAMRYLNASVEIRKKLEDEIGLGVTYFHFGELWVKVEKTDRAERYFRDAVTILEENQKYDELGKIYMALGNLKYNQRLYSEAKVWYEKAINLANDIGAKEYLLDGYESLSRTYYLMNKYEEAYHYLKLAKLLSDDSHRFEVQQKLNEQQLKYEADFNQQTMDQLKRTNNIQRLEREKNDIFFYVILIGLLVAAFIAGLLFRQNQLKKKHTKTLVEQNRQIEAQNEELKMAKLDAEEALKVKSEFLTTVSHEIRTPMNAIVGMTDLLNKTKLDKTQYTYLETIKNSSENLLVLLNDILDFSKLESSNLKLEVRRVELKQLMKVVYELYNPIAREKNLNYNLELSDDLPEFVFTDASRLKQILNNLLSNAFKFTHKGGISLNVEVKDREKTFNGELVTIEFSVVDSGIGISKEMKERIFNAFSQIDGSVTRRYGGIGLGLSISQSLTEMMGGKIFIESEIDKGSRFSFTLRLKAEKQNPHERAEKIKEKNTHENTAEIASRYPMEICIAEDNAINQELLVIILQKLGYEPIIVGNGEELLNKWSSNNIDLIFMDVQMPVMDGITATKRLREISPNPHHPVIVAVTANVGNDDRILYLNSGMNDYISKPYTTKEIVEAIKNWYSVIKTHYEKKNQ